MLDLSNQRFGKLTALHLAPRPRRYWTCRCVCGVVKDIRADALRANGGTRSCGCLQRAVTSARGYHHAPGERFSRLVIIRQVGTVPKRGRVYLCLCDCGKKLEVQGRFLRPGLIRSCGCLYRETRTTNVKHGQCRIRRKTPIYSAYQRRKSLCRTKARYYENVKFLFSCFLDFYREVGDRPNPDCWLFRINDSGDFEPGNLEWRPIRRHKKRRKRKLKFSGMIARNFLENAG